jgi:hypothetical protein
MTEAHVFNDLLLELQEPGQPVISATKFAEKLALEHQQLASLAHVHRNTVGRTPESPALQAYLRQSLRVIAAATDLTGDRDKALYWFRNAPIGLFSYQTPETIVSAGQTDALVRYIESLGAGSAG